MIISFFTHNVFATGVDYSTHPDLIFQGEIADDFDFSRQSVTLEGDEGNYAIKIEDLSPPKENEQEKFARVFQKLVQAESLEIDKKDELLEGVEFSNKQIGDLIQARVFEDNPHAESAMQAKVIGMLLGGKKDESVLAEAVEVQKKVNEVRAFFGLSAL